MNPPRPVDLIVMKDAGCPLLKQGDRWIVHGPEVRPQGTARLCGRGLCTLYPQVQAYLRGTPANRPLLSKLLYCTSEGCQSVFEAVESKGDLRPAQNMANAYQGLTMQPPPTQFGGMQAPQPTTAFAPGSFGAAQPQQSADEPFSPTMILNVKQNNTVPFMSRVPPKVAVQLTTVAKKASFADSELILKDGVMGQSLYIVADGEVEVVRKNAMGQEVRLAVLGIGECFGEMSLITQQPTTALVRSRHNAVVFTIPKEKVQQILRTSPDLLSIFTQMLAERIKMINAPAAPAPGGTAVRSGISGKLSLISIIDLVQTLRSSRRSGTLSLSANNQQALIMFKDGAVHSGVSGNKKAEEAFFLVAGWEDADFHFDLSVQDLGPQAQIKTETMSLLMDAMRRMDEATRKK